MLTPNAYISKETVQEIDRQEIDLINNRSHKFVKYSRSINLETTTPFLLSHDYQRNIAAKKIQQFYKKYVAAKSYKYMFEGGTDFKKYKELKPAPSKTLEYLDRLQVLSTKFINEIKEQLGELTKKEKTFVDKISSLNNFTLKHQTVYKLHHLDKQQKQKLTLVSSLYLDQHNIKVKSNTFDDDIKRLKNQDFVFFSIDFSGNDIYCKPSGSYVGGVDYGYRAYTIKQDKEDFSYFTLSDHLDNQINPTKTISSAKFYAKFSIAHEKVKRFIFGKLGNRDIPIFTKKDIPSALAYYCILFVRQCKNEDFNNYVYSDLSLKNIDILFNSIFNPEVHIPRLVVTHEFAEHILREPDIEEVYYSGDINKIINVCLSDYNRKIRFNIPIEDSLLTAVSNFVKIIEKASADNNIEILQSAIQQMERLLELKVTHIFCSQNCILGYKIQLAIIEKNVGNLETYLKTISNKSYFSIAGMMTQLLKSDDCLQYANTILKFYKNDQQQSFVLNYNDKEDLYILAGKFKEMPLNKNISSYDSISNSLSLMFNKRIALSKYIQHQHQYISYIAYSIIQHKPSLIDFTKCMNLYVWRELNQNIPTIDEDIIFAVLNNFYLTKQSHEILKNAFIESGILIADKQIKGYFCINKDSIPDDVADNFIEREDSLKNYAANRYDINL